MTYFKYGPSVTAVAAYSYEAETLCQDCMHQTARAWTGLPENVRREMENVTTEAALDLAAQHLGIDRNAEDTFNSCRFPDSVIPVFPKVVLEGQLCQEDCGDDSCDHEAAQRWHEKCPGCGVDLCEQ